MPFEHFRGIEIVPYTCYYGYTILCAILICLGITFKIIFNSFSPYTSHVNTNFIIVIIITTGCLNILYNIMECVCRKRSFALLCYVTFPALLFMQITVVCYGFYQTLDYNNFIYKDIQIAVNEYKTNSSTKNLFKQLERRMDCCGVNGPEDYLPTFIPESCCPPNAAIGGRCTRANSYKTGCVTKVYNEIMWLITILSGIILMFIALQVFTGIFIYIKIRNYPLGTSDEFLRLLTIN